MAALATAVVAVQGGWETWRELRSAAADFPWQVNLWYLFAALGCAVGALLCTGRLWATLFHQAGGGVGNREAIAAWIASNLGRYIPGKIWQLTGIAAYLRVRGDSGAAGFATSLALQAVILVTGAGVGVGLAGGSATGVLDPPIAIGLGALLLIGLHPRVLDRIISLGARLLKEPVPENRMDLSTLAIAGLIGVWIWATYGLGFWFLVRGLAPDVSLAPWTSAGVFASAYVAGYIVLIAPGGLVVREGALAALLTATTGMPLGVTVAIAAGARVWTTAAELIAFALVAPGLRRGGDPR